MTQIFGHFIARKDDQGEYLTIGFSPTSIPCSNAGAIMGSPPTFLPIISRARPETAAPTGSHAA
jgi:hypothetical protein